MDEMRKVFWSHIEEELLPSIVSFFPQLKDTDLLGKGAYVGS